MKTIVLLFSTLLLLCAFSCGQQIIMPCAPNVCLPATSITVSANPTVITLNGVSVLKAIAVDSNNNANVDVTGQCVWSSSNPAILSVIGNIATGLAAGSATANCMVGGITGTTPVTISVSSVVITSPICATQPCILPGGSNGVAYSGFTFTASGANTPFTWSGWSGCGLSLNASTGALTGTAATGTCTPTITVTDSASNTATVQVSVTISSGACSGGPPTYPCSTTSTANPGVVPIPITSGIASGTVNTSNSTIGSCTPLASQACVLQVSGTTFSTTWPTQNITINGTVYPVVSWIDSTHAKINQVSGGPGTLSGVGYTNFASCTSNCVNATFYDTTLNPTSVGDCVTRVTDGTTFNNATSIAGTPSGGANDIMSSVNETYIGISSANGSTGIFHTNTSGTCLQIVNTGHVGISVAGNFGFSKVTDTRFYYLVGRTQLWQGDITSDSTYTPTEVYDLTGATGGFVQCPGINWSTFGTPTSGSIMGIKSDDSRFGWSVGPKGQGSADWVFVYDRSLGCSTINLATGQVWGFCAVGCSSSTPPLGTLGTTNGQCWGSLGSTGKGIHDTQMSGDGQYIWASLTGGGWTQGACAGSTITSEFTWWQIGTLGDIWMYSAADQGSGAPEFNNHPSAGQTHLLGDYTNNSDGYTIRNDASPRTFTSFFPTPAAPGVTDQHCSWPHPGGVDTYYWDCASDAQLIGQSSGTNCGTGAGQTPLARCPTYLQNVVYSVNPNGSTSQKPILFTHTFSGNPPSGIYAKLASGAGDGQFGSQFSIGFATAKGNFYCWASTIFQSLGNDPTGVPRTDAFCVRLN